MSSSGSVITTQETDRGEKKKEDAQKTDRGEKKKEDAQKKTDSSKGKCFCFLLS